MPTETKSREIEALGAKIRELRKSRRWTLVDLESRIGVNIVRISEAERGRLDPDSTKEIFELTEEAVK